jgi:hypothetical protein
VLPVVAQVEGVGELLGRPQPAQPGLAPSTDRWGSSPSHQRAGMITVPSAKVNSCRWLWSQRANASSMALPSCSNVAVRAAISTRPGLGHKSPVCTPCTNSTVIAR